MRVNSKKKKKRRRKEKKEEQEQREEKRRKKKGKKKRKRKEEEGSRRSWVWRWPSLLPRDTFYMQARLREEEELACASVGYGISLVL